MTTRKIIGRLILAFGILFLAWLVLGNWSFVFKHRIVGEVVTVERIVAPVAVINNPGEAINRENFSFSIAIKNQTTSEIHMASSEDRQWGAVQKGNCVVAAFFPYPPWNLKKGMTDHNARLLKNFTDCAAVSHSPSFWERIQFFFLWG